MLEYQNQSQAAGSFTSAGTPAAVRVNLGWQPSYVKFFVADTTPFTGEFFHDMAAASFIKTISHADTQVTVETSNGVTLNAATTSALQDGFTMGTACQVTTKVTHWVAIR